MSCCLKHELKNNYQRSIRSFSKRNSSDKNQQVGLLSDSISVGKSIWLVGLCLFFFRWTSDSYSDVDSPSINLDVEKYVLDNGLTVILHEDHSSGLVSYHTWFRVGSKDENPNLTGLAHLFEHMMFKGAKRYTGKEYEELLRRNGGRNNAFTSHDYTGYYVNIGSSKLELVMDLESDRMESLAISEVNLNSERDVVKEERRFRVDNNITGFMQEKLFSTVYNVHSYKWPIIGSMEHLGNATVEQCKDFFKRYYAPNNAVLVVVGDFKTSKVKKLINKYYAHIRPQEIKKNKILSEPVQQAARQVTVSKEIQNPRISIGYPTSKAGDIDSYVLDVLSNILGGGESSRLHRKLVVERELASMAGTYSYSPEDPGIFNIAVDVRNKGRYVRGVILEVIDNEISKLKTSLVTDVELEQAKKFILLSHIESLKTASGKAQSLALNEVVMKDYRFLFSDLDKYQSVTAEDIIRVSKKYFDQTKRNLIVVKPKR